MYPSTLATLTDPVSSDRLNSPSHSGIETAQNTNIEAIQNFIGVEGSSSTVGTLIYDVRSPASDGGGHVQTAVKGGTGQTTFTKGDLLVAQSASVIGRLTVGNDGQVLTANSSTASGIQWVNNANAKVASNASVITLTAAAPETSIASATVSGSVMGINNVLKATAFIGKWDTIANSSVLFYATYGGTRVNSVMAITPRTYTDSVISGRINYTLIANNSATQQRGILELSLGSQQNLLHRSSLVSVYIYDTNTSSVNSSANQSFGITAKLSDGNDAVRFDGSYIERLI